jgi:peptidoglycan/xylan/chitin deacetylase (PgdA/CDA1 family)
MSVSVAEHRAAWAQGRVLRVVNWHSTPASAREKLRWELTRYTERFAPVTLADLDSWYETGRWTDPRPGFLPAFYDGYRNGYDVAAAVCEELGVRAVFFPPTAFLSTPVTEQRAFTAAHDIEVLPEEAHHERLAMTWEELADIATRHDVGGHSASHQQASRVLTSADVDREVTEPLRLLQERTGTAPAAWAWLWGTPYEAGTAASAALRDAGVRYLFSNTSVERIA